MNFYFDISIHFSLLLLNCVYYYINRTKISKPLKTISAGVLIRIIFDSSAILIIFSNKLKQTLNGNMIVYHIFTPVEYCFFAYFFYQIFKSAFLKKAIAYSIPMFFVISFFISLQLQEYYQYNSYSLLMKYCLLIFWVLFYFGELMHTKSIENLLKFPPFLICIGLLLHSAINIFIDGFANYLLKNVPSDFELTYTVYSISNYMLFLIIFIALITDSKNSKNAS